MARGKMDVATRLERQEKLANYRDNIFRVRLAAYGRELAKLNSCGIKNAGAEPAVRIIQGRSPVSGW